MVSCSEEVERAAKGGLILNSGLFYYEHTPLPEKYIEKEVVWPVSNKQLFSHKECF